MKSKFGDRETLGSMLVNTHEEHLKSKPLEVGELIDQYGKQYMSDLYDYIEEGSKEFDQFYINILSRKTKLYLRRAIEVFPYIMPVIPMMQTNQEVWYIDCEKQEIKLLWSLPDESEFDIILNAEDADPQAVHWIKEYKRLQKESKKKKWTN